MGNKSARIRKNRKTRMRMRINFNKNFVKNEFEDFDTLIESKRSDSIFLNKESLIDRNILETNLVLLKDVNIWHAFILKNTATLTRKFLLETLMDFLKPVDIIPVHFKYVGKDCVFLSFSCVEAVFKLYRNNLEIHNLLHQEIPIIQCEIILRYNTVQFIPFDLVKTNYFNNLKTLMKGGVLDLENFAEKEMPEYWPPSQPKILQIILGLSKKLEPTHVKLNKNEIWNLLPLVVLWGTNVTILDLRNNLINISQLEVLKMINLSELWLDGNPLCDEFDEFTYVKRMKAIFPNLKKLDGVSIGNNLGPVFRRNFLCDTDVFDLVNQFLEFYFPLYDSYRNLLQDVYHRNATFSSTTSYIRHQETSDSAELSAYGVINRNLIDSSDFNNKQDLLVRGAPSIVKKLLELPTSKHDPSSFTVDLIYHKSVMSVISITGMFQEYHDQTSNQKHCMLCFSKGPIALYSSNGEYTIINDLMHVYNALTCQVYRSFRVRKPPTTICVALTDRDKVKAIEGIQLVTGLKRQWAERLLVDSKKDLVKCLRTFMDNAKVDKFPSDAFDK